LQIRYNQFQVLLIILEMIRFGFPKNVFLELNRNMEI